MSTIAVGYCSVCSRVWVRRSLSLMACRWTGTRSSARAVEMVGFCWSAMAHACALFMPTASHPASVQAQTMRLVHPGMPPCLPSHVVSPESNIDEVGSILGY